MTRYTVVWDKDVESDFIQLWMTSDSETRAILTEAADWIDRHLCTDPERQGEPRHDMPVRILPVPTSPPTFRHLVTPSSPPRRVSVVYQVVAADRLVRVLRLILRR